MHGLVVGVLGLGLGRHYVEGFSMAEGIDRLIVCDASSERVASVRTAHPGIAAGYSDLDTMLAQEHPDAVAVITPDFLHRRHAEQCLAAGCHVLLTKPIANVLQDGVAIIDAAHAAGRKLMIGMERRFRPSAVWLREMIEAGEFGDIIHIRCDRIADRRPAHANAPWKATAEGGRTPIVSSGIHEVDLVRYLAAKRVTSVSALSNRLGPLDFWTDKTTTALFGFEGGGIGEVTVTYEAKWPKSGAITSDSGDPSDDFRLVGTKGLVLGRRYALDGWESWQQLPDDSLRPTGNSIHNCAKAFVAALLGTAPLTATGDDALQSMAVAFAAEQSAATGEIIDPAEVLQAAQASVRSQR